MSPRFACISASNVENARQNSASTHACELVREILSENGTGDAEVDIIRLLDYEPAPCRMCGRCFVSGECARDDDFNAIYDRLKTADAVFVVCPHYASIPAKLVIILEKLQEMAFLNSCANSEYRSPLYGKPVGIIAHGGQTDEALPYYRKALLEPLATAFASVQMKVVGLEDDDRLGVVFGIRSIASQTDSIFVKIEHNWDQIRDSITPLVKKVATAVE